MYILPQLSQEEYSRYSLMKEYRTYSSNNQASKRKLCGIIKEFRKCILSLIIFFSTHKLYSLNMIIK